IGEAGLGCLGQCSNQRNSSIRVASGAMEATQPTWLVHRWVMDITEEGGYANLRRDIPQPHRNAGLVVFGEQRPTVLVVYGSNVENPPRLCANAKRPPQCNGVALDQFA